VSKEMPKSVKGVIGWTLGVGIIAFILLILVIIFGNLSGNVGFTQESTAFTDETILLSPTGSIPTTAQGRTNGALTSVVVSNATGGETILASGNYTVSGVTIIGVGTSPYNNTNVNVSATVSYDSQGQIDSDSVINNYTASARNTSAQFPTVGTIIGIAILLAILISLLVFAIRRMMGVSDTGKGSSSINGQRGFG
jgi:hypothetical protein